MAHDKAHTYSDHSDQDQGIATTDSPTWFSATISTSGTANIDFTKVASGTFSFYNDGSGHLKGEDTASGQLYVSGGLVGFRPTADALDDGYFYDHKLWLGNSNSPYVAGVLNLYSGSSASYTTLDYAKVNALLTTNGLVKNDGAGAFTSVAVTAAAESILDDTTVGNIRTTLGVGTGDSPAFVTVDCTGITDGRVPYVSAAGLATTALWSDTNNVGLGVTAADGWGWYITKAFHFPNGTYLAGRTDATSALFSGSNNYLDGTDNRWEYHAAGEATQHQQQAGRHYFRVAASGTAGGAITWLTPLTLELDGGILIPNVPSGATQAAAGAVANEIWKTASHATLPDNVLMVGA